MNKRQKIVSFALVIVLMILIFSRTILNFIIDYQWFTNVGYLSAYLVKLKAFLIIGLPLWVVTALIFSVYYLWVEKTYFKRVHVIVDMNKNENKPFKRVAILSAIGVTALLALSITSNLWFSVLQFIHATSFGIKDPVFDIDIGFYVFKLPLYQSLIAYTVIYLVVMAISTAVIYFVLMGLKPPTDVDFSEFQNVKTIRDLKGVARKGIIQSLIIKLGFFGLLVFVLLAAFYWIQSYQLLYSPRGVAYGASFTDIHISLLGYRVKAVIALLGAVTFMVGLNREKYRLMLAGPMVLFAVTIGFALTATVVQTFVVEPNEIAKETQFLEYNIAYTQKAFNVEEIPSAEYPVADTLNDTTLAANDDIIKNIRINDYRPLKQTYNQIQGIRLYYEFSDIDVDRYMIDGQYTQVFLAAREMNQDKLQVQTWQNQHIKFTHGYGIALSPVNMISSDGQPMLLVKNIPPVTETDLRIDRPEIYFGELTNDYIIVKTSEKEFDYPKGSDNQETVYEGESGLKMTFFNRILFALREADFRILVSSIIDSESQIIIRRNVLDRLRTIAPFIMYDQNPYIVANQEDGQLYWIVDGYTVSTNYPYSQPYDETRINYIRNAVKAVVNAYTGDVAYYVYDEQDPILQTYKKIFTEVFKDQSDMPLGLQNHVRYPKALFSIQAEVYRKYHVTNPVVFYNGEDIWDVGTEIYMNASEVNPIDPNYAMFKLPGEDKVEFLLSVPYTPKEKANMTSLFVARNDKDHYGEFFLYKFPKDRTIQGPALFETRIDQDSTISAQMTLWGQKGSTVLRGNILIIPIENSLLYIEPIYLQADNQESLPEMKQVVVGYKDRIVMAETLQLGLDKIFGGKYTIDDLENDTGIEGVDEETLIQLMNEAYQQYEMTKEQLEDLKTILDKLNQQLNLEKDARDEAESDQEAPADQESND